MTEPNEPQQPITFDPDTWTGGDTPERRAQELQEMAAKIRELGDDAYEYFGIDRHIKTAEEVAQATLKIAGKMAHGVYEARTLPLALLGLGMIFGSVPTDKAVLGITAYSHIMRTRAQMQHEDPDAKRPGVKGIGRIIQRIGFEFDEAMTKTGFEIMTADRNGDGKVSLDEYGLVIRDVIGNFIPGEGLGDPAKNGTSGGVAPVMIDAVMSFLSYGYIGLAGQAASDALGVTDVDARRLVGTVVALGLVPLIVSSSKNDRDVNAMRDIVQYSDFGEWAYKTFLDGCLGDGDDKYARGLFDHKNPDQPGDGPHTDGPHAGGPSPRGPRGVAGREAMDKAVRQATEGQIGDGFAIVPHADNDDAATEVDPNLPAQDVVIADDAVAAPPRSTAGLMGGHTKRRANQARPS